MLKKINSFDGFTRNIIIVFVGTSAANFLNLLYQLLIAHRLPIAEFAAFNSLLAIYMVISAPLATIQFVIARFIAKFNARNESGKISFLLSDFFKKALFFAVLSFIIFLIFSHRLILSLKVPTFQSGYFLAALIALAALSPLLAGALQGLEIFSWLAAVPVLTGVLKVLLAFLFLALGFGISGALGALLLSVFIGLVIFYLPLSRFISLKKIQNQDVGNREILWFLFPVATSNFCFISLVSMDMILVKYFFTPEASGFYSLAQMAGKIFLFLPAAISIVMFPRTSGLNARNLDTKATLKRSLFFVLALSILANLIYNFFPRLILVVLTGKAYPESVLLGRLFGISMSFFALLFILISYFLSLNDLRFIKYLSIFTLLELGAIFWQHQSLIAVQLILCLNAAVLFLIHLILVYKKVAVGK